MTYCSFWHDRGVLNLLRGLVGGGDSLISAIARGRRHAGRDSRHPQFSLADEVLRQHSSGCTSQFGRTVDAGAKREKAHKRPDCCTSLAATQ